MTDHTACLLVREIAEVAKAIRELHVAISIEREERKLLHVIERKLDDLHNQGVKLMSKISDFADKQDAFNKRQADAVDSAVASVTALTDDVASLKDKIAELQNSAGGVTPEDQVRIDSLESQGDAVVAKVEALATALKTLDDLTPPKAPPTA